MRARCRTDFSRQGTGFSEFYWTTPAEPSSMRGLSALHGSPATMAERCRGYLERLEATRQVEATGSARPMPIFLIAARTAAP